MAALGGLQRGDCNLHFLKPASPWQVLSEIVIVGSAVRFEGSDRTSKGCGLLLEFELVSPSNRTPLSRSERFFSGAFLGDCGAMIADG